MSSQIFVQKKQSSGNLLPPGAPDQNGCAESLEKFYKLAIKKAIGKQELTPFEL